MYHREILISENCLRKHDKILRMLTNIDTSRAERHNFSIVVEVVARCTHLPEHGLDFLSLPGVAHYVGAIGHVHRGGI